MLSNADNHDAPLYRCALDGQLNLIDIHQCFPEQFPFMLETATGTHGQHRYSLLFARAMQEEPLTLSFAALSESNGPDFLDSLDAAFLDQQRADNSGLPFVGGWFVLLGYELAAQIEPSLKLAAPELEQPVATAWRCDAAVIIDQHSHQHTLVAESQVRLNELQRLLAMVRPARQILPVAPWQVRAGPAEEFCRGVRRIQEYIRAGDVFQVNLSRDWQAIPCLAADQSAAGYLAPEYGVSIYRALRRANPAPFAGLARFGDTMLLSSSPERLVEADNGWVQTRPIAGTRPRGRTARDDVRLSDELLANPKERAEHIMLIDLERNDLGRVCVPGSVTVNELMVKESYASVHHIVSNVRGRLRSGTSPGQVIAAVFPGGTITGCPKVRCMQIIAELETAGRGAYTGAMGYLSRHGRLDLNILIRSMLWRHGRLHWRTGCGIVADSVPEQELAETEAKAAGMLRALEVNEA